MNTKKIGFTSSLLICIGIVIGSGIFFKLDTIYSQTGYNYIYTTLAWLIVGIFLAFSGYATAHVALKAEDNGGLISFTEFSTNKFFAHLVGIFQYFIYIPMFSALLSIISSGYFLSAFNIDSSVYVKYILAFLILFIIFIVQYNSTSLTAKISDVSTVLKVIPLIVIFLLGIIFGDYTHFTISYSQEVSNGFDIKYLFGPFIAIALAFDGWMSIGSIQKDMINPKKDLYKVYIYSLLIITFIYLLYSIGVGLLLTPEDFQNYGSEYILEIGKHFGGQIGASLLLVFVVISTFGALNGTFLTGVYYVEASAKRKEILGYKILGKRNEKTKTFTNSIIYNFIAGLVMMLIFFSQELLVSLQIENVYTSLLLDDLTILLGSVFLFIFFFGLIFKHQLFKTNKYKILISSIFAVILQVFIFISFYLTNDHAVLYSFLGLFLIFIVYFVNKIFIK